MSAGKTLLRCRFCQQQKTSVPGGYYCSSTFKRIISLPNPSASPDDLVCVWLSFRICECTEAEAEIILQLKSELREKELKLTDIRLEALSSAHHLDQIREAMNRMQVCTSYFTEQNGKIKASLFSPHSR